MRQLKATLEKGAPPSPYKRCRLNRSMQVLKLTFPSDPVKTDRAPILELTIEREERIDW